MSKLQRYTKPTWTAARHFDQQEVDENDAEILTQLFEPSDSELIHSSRNSSRFENFFYACFPNLLLQSTPWEEQWNRKERSENIAVWRVVFLIISLVYIAHYYFLDRPMGLTPTETWFQYRFSLAGIFFASFLFYYVRFFFESRIYRMPVYFSCWSMCYWQANSMLWYEDSLYLYAFAFVIVSTVLLRTSLLKSMTFAVVTLATQYPAYLMTDISRPLIFSATAVTIIFVYISRSKYLDDIKYFLAVQQNAQSQKQVIELSIDFNDRIRALLPKEISRRLTYFLSKRGLTVLQAMDEVLQPQQKEICALFSDIRGFTEGTKDLDRFINHAVLPNVRDCASAVELNQGIPRKIGDLIFAYFDDPNRYVNLIRSIRAGMEIAKVNQAFNKNNPNGIEIRRHILIATGEAVVGNLGGMDSSIEITALGSPVNFLSRLDELTKTPQLKPHLKNPCLLLCSATASHLEELELGLTLKKLNLHQMGLQIRSFEDVEEVFIMYLTASIERILEAASKHIQSSYNDTFTTPN